MAKAIESLDRQTACRRLAGQIQGRGRGRGAHGRSAASRLDKEKSATISQQKIGDNEIHRGRKNSTPTMGRKADQGRPP